jgi:WD40 repeat protein
VNDLGTNPYVGPRSFEEADSHNFFGRHTEGRQLASLIIAHRVVLFYAQSGAGKTSLLQASVIPALKRRRMMGVLPVTRVGGDLPPGIAGNQVENIYVFNALLNLEKTAALPEKLVGLTLSAGLKPYLQPEGDGERPRPSLLILDQFEELFTHHPERYQERAAFFSQLRDCLETYPNLSLLLSMREEHIAELDFYSAHMPDRLRTRFRIEFMTRESALEAVAEPASHAGRPFEPGVAQDLVDNLRRIPVSRVGKKAGNEETALGKFIEPVHLQIVCHQLWESLPPGGETIRAEDVSAFGDVDQALALFYEDVVKRVGRGAGVSQGRLRTWFDEQLITPAQTRGLVFRGDRETAGLANDVVDRLDRAYLIRAEIRHGAPWYELSHDRFIAPIQRSNREWRAARQARLVRSVIGVSLLILLAVISFGLIALGTAGGATSALAQAAAQKVTLAAATNIALEATSTQSAAVAQATAQAANATATQSAREARAAEQAAAAAQATATQSAGDAQAAATAAAAAAAEAAAESSDLALSVARSRVRPLRPGLSLSGASAVPGTIGAFVRDGSDQVYLLVVSPLLSPPGCELGMPVVQPGRADGGQSPEDVIGLSARCLPLQDGAPLANMVGLVRLDGDLGFETNIPGIGSLRGVRQPAVGDSVRMLGRSSGLVSGEITDLSASLPVGLGGGVAYQFTNVIMTTPMWAAGDSGALVVDQQGYAVGILVAGSTDNSALAPLGEVLDSLGVELLHTGTQLASLDGRSPAMHAAWSPDGTYLASAYEDATIILWDAATGRPLQTLAGHSDAVTSLAWSPDGRLLASGSWDGQVILWGPNTGEPLRALRAHTDVVESVAWSPDGSRIASASRDGDVILWDLGSGQPAQILSGHTGAVTSLAWSPDGRLLASGSRDATIILWDLESGKPAQDLRGHKVAVQSVAWSPDGRLASGSDDGTIILWDPETGRPLQTLVGHQDRVSSVAWSPDGRLASGSWDGQVILWDLESGEPAQTLEGPSQTPTGLSWSPGAPLGAHLAFASLGMLNLDLTASLWDVWGAQPPPALGEPVPTGETRSIRSVTWSPNGTRLAAAGNDGIINIWLVK